MMKKLHFALLAACIVLGSCSTGEAASAAISQMYGGSSQALLFINCKAVSEDEIVFEFSQSVTVKSLNFEPALVVASVEEGSTIRVKLEEIPVSGMEITADILAEDADRNTINVLVPFRARNNRMPKLAINEILTEGSGTKTEFVELRTLTAGNLGGMRVVINGNTNAAKETVYVFLPVEVAQNEYITLHLRTKEASCKDEYGENLDESGGEHASASARDFWMPGDKKLVHKTATAVYVLDQDDHALDAVMISDSPVSSWAKDYLADAANMLYQQGAWKTPDGKACGPADSVMSGTTTNTRSICRDESAEDTGTAANWYVTVGSGKTPGKPNNPGRFKQ